MTTRLPQLGSVIWAAIADANGQHKIRPCVVVTPTKDILPGKHIQLVAVTTRLPIPLPDDYLLLPWDNEGKARSGLRRKCAAVASWQITIPVEDVQSIGGQLPTATISELLEKILARQRFNE